MGHSILFASGKGGVGRTTFTVNMGATLAFRGARVALLDLNIGLRNLDIYLGLEDAVLYDMGDVISGVCSVEKALVHHPVIRGLSLLSCWQYKNVNGITPAHIRALCDSLKTAYDFVLIDGPVGTDDCLSMAAAGADSAVVVVTPDYTALRNGDMVEKRLRDMGLGSRVYAVNMVKPELFGRGLVPDLGQIHDMFSIPLAGIVPYDENINIGNNSGYPIVCNRSSYISKNFDSMVGRMIG